MSTIKVNPINTEDLEKETNVMELANKSKYLIISNQEQLDQAAGILVEIKKRYKELDTQRKEITNPIDAAKKSIMDLFRKPLTMLEDAEAKIKKAIIRYDDEQREIARQEQIKLQKLADQEAEKQKKLLDAKIERAEASGKVEKVEELLVQKENIVPIAAPVVAPKIDQPSGVSYKTTWTAEVVDADLIPREYMIPNIQALTKIAQATKGTLTIPGVKFVSTKIIASRS